MLAFHNDPQIKEKYLARIRAHAAADQIIHGYYWENGKGCAVGCTIHTGNHTAYETELGIPQALARLEDRLFEGQKKSDAKNFPERFLLAARVGADLSRVHWKFLYWLLTEELAGREYPLVRDAVKQCADLLIPLMKGESLDPSAARSAESAAWSAARSAKSAESAARSAAYRRMADKLISLMEEAPVL
jgi:hypothetical protein